jgi:hypothetical protein
MRTSSPRASGHSGTTGTTTAGGGEDEESVWTSGTGGGAGRGDSDYDEQSYYTHSSAGSMGLAKRPNTELTMMTYVSLDDNEQPQHHEQQHGAATVATADYQDCADSEDEQRTPEEEDGDEEYFHPSSREEIHDPEQDHGGNHMHNKPVSILRRKNNKNQDSVLPDHHPLRDKESLFDHSSSTHKARGALLSATAAPSVSTSTSSSSHWRLGAGAVKPELSIITDVRDEEDADADAEEQEEEAFNPKSKTKTNKSPGGRRPVAEDLADIEDPMSPDNHHSGTPTNNDGTPTVLPGAAQDAGADTRNRRRERLSRLARIKSPSRKDALSPARSTNSTSEEALSPRQQETHHVMERNNVASPSGGNVASPYRKHVASPSRNNMASPSRNNVASPSTSRNVTSPSRGTVASPSSSTLSPTKKSSTNVVLSPSHRAVSERTLSPKTPVASPKNQYSSPKNYPRSPQAAVSNHPTNGMMNYHRSPQRGNGSPRKAFFPDEEEEEEEDEYQKVVVQQPQEQHTTSQQQTSSKPYMEKFLQKYNVKKHAAKDQHHRQWAAPAPVLLGDNNHRPPRISLPTVREVSAGSVADVSDNCSVLTHNLQEGPPCIQQIIQSAQFAGGHKDGTTDGISCAGYTQTATSFVTGVWKSCGMSGYQTESKKSLLQLERIAEQSVSTICNPGRRQSPDAFEQHSRGELVSQSDSYEDNYTQGDSMTDMTDKDNSCYSKQLVEMRSDEETVFEDDANPPFGYVENALTSIGAKVQEVVGFAEDRKNDSMMDDMRHMFDSLSTYYTPHHQPYDGDNPSRGAPPFSKNDNAFQFRHGVTGGGGQGSHSMFSHTPSEDQDVSVQPLKPMSPTVAPRQQQQQQQQRQQQEEEWQHQPKNNAYEVPKKKDQAPQREKLGAVASSIYSSVSRNTKDRRSMFMELQRRRMKNTKRKDEWDPETNNPPQQKGEDETAKLRQLYVGLYDKIHDQTEDRQEQEANEVKTEESGFDEPQQQDHGQEIPQDDDRDGTFSEANCASEDEEEDYAVVWAASEASASSPRHTTAAWGMDEHSNASPRQTVWATSGASMTSPRRSDAGSLVDNDSNDEEDEDNEEEYLDFEDKESTTNESQEPVMQQEELALPELPKKTTSLSMDQQRSCDSPYTDCKSTHTSYLDAEEFAVDSTEETHFSEAVDDQYLEPQPDPTISIDESSSARAADDAVKDTDSDDTDTDTDDDTRAYLIPSIGTGTSTTCTNDMDELVNTFLESKSELMSDNLRDNSESSRPMVLLSENSFQERNEPPPNQPSLEDLPEEEEEEVDKHGEQQDHEHDAESYHSEDYTLADSTMVSGYSGSNHTQDLSMAESIVSDGLHSRNGSSRSAQSDDTPEVSDVPPEIAQPLGPISEYQVLYQISEEDDEDVEQTSNESDATGSFEHQNDVPFDEDVSLEDYQKKSSVRKIFSSICQWVVLGTLAYYLGVGSWLMDASMNSGASSSQLLGEETMATNPAILPTMPTIDDGESFVVKTQTVQKKARSHHHQQQQQQRQQPPSPKKPTVLELPLFDGITVVEGHLCRSVPFAMGESVPLSESDAYRHTWAMELQAALKDY